ncbi:MAG TPA: hypothetical protein VFY58_02985 [Nocardioides sp.]|nr:hypothetical protein [Nocardioides sp.]
MNAEHKRPLFAFLILTVIAAVVFANGLQRQVLDVIRNGGSTIVAGTSLLHDPLYVVEEGARIATEPQTGEGQGDTTASPPTPPAPLPTEDDTAEGTSPATSPNPVSPTSPGGSAAGPTGSAPSSGNATGNAPPGGNVGDDGQGRPRHGDDAAGNQGPGAGGPVAAEPDEAEGRGEKAEHPETHGHGRSDDRVARRHDDSGPGKSDADHGRGHEQASGHGTGHDQGQHKAQGKSHGGGHDRAANGGKGKGQSGRGHGRH